MAAVSVWKSGGEPLKEDVVGIVEILLCRS